MTRTCIPHAVGTVTLTLMLSTTKRIGIHLGTGGRASTAVERAREIGANTFQIFSSSPRMWRAPKVPPEQCERMRALRAKYDVGPLVIHTSYLVNVCSQNEEVRQKSVKAFRGEIERALALGAEYLVLHPGSFRGAHREQGLMRTAAAISAAAQGLDLAHHNLMILIENTAGGEYSLGGSFEQVAEVMEPQRHLVPVAACINPCHTHAAGYDI